ncbi:hypothetical protein WCLP8_3520012 [uncultured Gammaproteobacteria bacterium]
MLQDRVVVLVRLAVGTGWGVGMSVPGAAHVWCPERQNE